VREYVTVTPVRKREQERTDGDRAVTEREDERRER
jgi:hypothetical protein